MLGLAALQRETGLPVQTHISENAVEIALVTKMFTEASSYADVYDRYGLLTDRTILAHAVHISDAEAKLIAQRGSAIAHCPCSNSALGSGAARVRWMWDAGLTVGLGTDMSGGYSASILEAARQAAMVSRQVGLDRNGDGGAGSGAERSRLSVEEVLYLATRGGAATVGLTDRVGGFETGKEWDAQLIGLGTVDGQGEMEGDAGNVEVFGWEDWEERMAKWLYTGDDRNTLRVWVKGRMVHQRSVTC
ncbi:hypothetical protein G7046_g6319 [Stylonectria norvegica]|nr:hypothetical protein G7046_g6319 [Stylonectria norvegica]